MPNAKIRGRVSKTRKEGTEMKILVAGLGLMGGSMAKSLKRAGYSVDGFDRTEVLSLAVKEGAIAAVVEDFSVYDIVFVALPPEAAIRFIDETRFAQNAVVADICGVKGEVESAVYAKPRNFRYVGCHPMTGKEVSGYRNSAEDLFDGASMIVTENEKTDEDAVRLLEDIFVKMGFGLIRHCTAQYHDKKIAYTSQLAHVVSNAYVKSRTADGYVGFTGGSFQDMTRIAGVDEKVWTQLYFYNRENLAEELETLLFELGKYADALRRGDREAFAALLKEGRERKEKLDREK